MKKTLIPILALVLLLAGASARAANTVNKSGCIVTVSAMDSDFDLAAAGYGPGAGWRLVSIEFFGGAANDRLLVKDGSDTGPEMFDRTIDDVRVPAIKYFMGAEAQPLIDYSECTLSAGHKVIFTLRGSR